MGVSDSTHTPSTEPPFDLEWFLGDRDLIRIILQHLPIGVFIVDEKAALVDANEFFSRMLGKNVEKLLTLRGGNIVACARRLDDPRGCGHGPACRTCRLRESVMRTMTEGVACRRVEERMTWEIEGGKKAQKELLISTAPLRLPDGKTRVLVTVEDVTEVKEREKEIADQRVSNEQLRVVTETAGGVAHELAQPAQVLLGIASLALQRSANLPELAEHLRVIQGHAERIGDLVRRMQQVTRYATRPYANLASIIDFDRTSAER